MEGDISWDHREIEMPCPFGGSFPPSSTCTSAENGPIGAKGCKREDEVTAKAEAGELRQAGCDEAAVAAKYTHARTLAARAP
jgi:hypothetical protein